MLVLEVENGKLVRKGFQDLGNAIPKVGRLQIYRTTQEIFKSLGIYPEVWPGQVYKRTYTSRSASSRSIEKIENGYIVRFDPVDKRNTHYGVYLRGTAQDENTQARYFRGHWVPFAVITQTALAKLPVEVRDALKKISDQVGQEMKSGK